MGFKYVVIFSIVAAGGFGGGLHYYQNNGLPKFLQSDRQIDYADAAPFREACKRDFARYVTNREAIDLNSSCVCFGATVARLEEADRKSVLKALKDKAKLMRPGGQSSGHISINTPEIASDVYRKCDMRPRAGEVLRTTSPS